MKKNKFKCIDSSSGQRNEKSVVLSREALQASGVHAADRIRQEGREVVVAGRRDEVGKALVKELRSFGSEAEFINADVRRLRRTIAL